MARPTKMTKDTLDKLEYAFSIGCTDLEACLFADISDDLLYKYQREHPKYIKRKEALKLNPCLKAKTVVMESIEGGDKSDAKWYLERRDPDFKQKKETDINLNPHEDFVKMLIKMKGKE